MEENILHLKNNTFLYKGNSYHLEDFYTEEFYRYADQWVKEHSVNEMYINILYIKVIQNILAIAFFLKINKIKEIKLGKSFDSQHLLYIRDAAEITKTSIETKKKKYKFSVCKARFVLFASAAYLFLKECFIKQSFRTIDYNKDVCVVRTVAAKKKIKPHMTREIFYEDKIGEGTLYSYFSRTERIKALKRAYIEANRQLKSLIGCMCDFRMKNTLPLALRLFSFRLVHICFYAEIIERLLLLPWKGRFLSGNNLDSYAFVEEKAAQKANINTVCIPHGLEYGFLFPHCFTGNIFFATSANAAKHLNQLYATNKFVYDVDVANEMFCMAGKISKTRKVVYFSEPREPEVNVQIIKALLPEMKKRNIPLYIKHHPKDDLRDYTGLENSMIIIDDLKEAVCGNICIARKSTVLLEGLYNDATCVAIVINEKDKAVFSMFPSLQNSGIKVFENISSLIQWLETMCKSTN